MKLWEAIREMISDSGKSMVAVSTAMGRSRNFITSYAHANRSVGSEVLSEICDACGCDLIVRNTSNGTEYVIDTSHDDGTNDSGVDLPQSDLVASVTFTKTLKSIPKTCHECPFATLCDGEIAKLTKSDEVEWTKMAMTRKPKSCPMIVVG